MPRIASGAASLARFVSISKQSVLPMRYRSTRSWDEQSYSFSHVLFQGLAPDGGLYIPVQVPALSESQMAQFSDLSFVDLATEIFMLFQDEIPKNELADLLTSSFSSFKATTPLVPLPGHDDVFILELFHGPTFAFKDVALQVLGNMFSYFLDKRSPKSDITVLGATSGDTGGAAIYGLRGKKNVNCVILHPYKRVSPVQEAQMCSVLDKNVYNVAVRNADFDMCQDIVKRLFISKVPGHDLVAINSINWARILSQTIYYFYSYFQLCKMQRKESVKVEYVVPTGNFGDILAGFYARLMGLPIKLAIATNENDILLNFLKTGTYEKSIVKETLSPAMDILISSNFERALWYFIKKDPSHVISNYMDELKIHGKFTVSPEVLSEMRCVFRAYRATDREIKECIGKYQKKGYLLDPHTAVGVWSMLHLEKEPGTVSVCLATAHPGKFPDAIHESMVSSGLKKLEEKEFMPPELYELCDLPMRQWQVETHGDVELGIQGIRTILENIKM